MDWIDLININVTQKLKTIIIIVIITFLATPSRGFVQRRGNAKGPMHKKAKTKTYVLKYHCLGL